MTLYDAESGRHLFPDSPSVRAVKHVKTLTKLRKQGFDVAVVYLCQYPAPGAVASAGQIDPEYAKAVRSARRAGVEFRAFRAVMEETRAVFTGEELDVIS